MTRSRTRRALFALIPPPWRRRGGQSGGTGGGGEQLATVHPLPTTRTRPIGGWAPTVYAPPGTLTVLNPKPPEPTEPPEAGA